MRPTLPGSRGSLSALVVAFGVCAVLATACGAAAAGGSSSRISHAHTLRRAPVVRVFHPGAASEPTLQSILAAVESGVDMDGVSSVGFIHSDPAIADGTWITATVPTTDSVLDQWRSLIIAGAVKHIAAADSITPPSGLMLSTPTGMFQAESIADCCNYGIAADTTDNLESKITAGLSSIGLTPISFTFDQPEPGDFAPEVVAQTTSSPSAFTSDHRYPAGDVFGDLNGYEGTYLKVVDASGDVVLETAYSMRTGNGVGGAPGATAANGSR